MKELAIIILYLEVISACSNAKATSTNEVSYLTQLIQTEDIKNIAGIVTLIEKQCSITVCFECEIGRHLSKTIDFDDKHAATVKGILDKLISLGYQCDARDGIILITSCGVKRLEDNPMDMCFEGFEFEGSRAEFIRKLVDEGVHVFLRNQPRVGNPFYKAKFPGFGSVGPHYSFDIKGKVSLRELLLQGGSQHGDGWYAEIREREKEEIYEQKMPDGTVSYGWNGRLLISFFEDMRSEVESDAIIKMKETSIFHTREGVDPIK